MTFRLFLKQLFLQTFIHADIALPSVFYNKFTLRMGLWAVLGAAQEMPRWGQSLMNGHETASLTSLSLRLSVCLWS